MKYLSTINGKTYSFKAEDIENLDIIGDLSSSFNILEDGYSLNGHIISIDRASKTVKLEIEKKRFEVIISSELDQLIDKMGLTKAIDSGQKELKAPMPGLIIDILVKEGQEVSKDDDLVVLEAMKMENILKAEAEGTIKSIHMKVGDSVEKHQVLIELE